MPDTATKKADKPATTTAEDTAKITSGGEVNAQSQGEIDGFQLVIDALKLTTSIRSSACPAFRSPTSRAGFRLQEFA